MQIVFLGPPGAGKGTQASIVCRRFGLAHISTGDMLRQAMTGDSDFARGIKAILSEGGLVPDELMVEIVSNRMAQEDCKNGSLLDGFPRTIAQADALAGIVDIDAVVYLSMELEALAQRIASRRVCSSCNTICNMQLLDSIEMICPDCGGELIQRDDDKMETVRNRLNIYERATSPLVDYYKQSGLLISIDAAQPIEAVGREIVRVLERLS